MAESWIQSSGIPREVLVKVMEGVSVVISGPRSLPFLLLQGNVSPEGFQVGKRMSSWAETFTKGS